MTSPDETSTQEGWGRNLAAARARLGITQADLAQRVGVTLVNVNRWENSARQPSLPRQIRLAEVLGVSVTELFPRTADEAELPGLVAALGNGCS
jgi:putative transcriptional regulator